MLNLQDADAKVVSINPRAEKHGDKNKLACDVKFTIVVSNTVLDHFSADLKPALYREVKAGDQQPLLAPSNQFTHRRLPKLGAVAWAEDFPGYEMTIGGGLRLKEPLLFVDVNLTKFQFTPQDGGSVQMVLTAQCYPDESEAGLLCATIGDSVSLSLTPPTAKARAEDAAHDAKQEPDPNQNQLGGLDAVADTLANGGDA